MNQILAVIIQTVLVLAVAPFAAGLVKFVKARLQGRQGASPFLFYVTLLTLFKKEMVISETSSWIFRMVPYVVFGSAVFLAAIAPLLFTGSASSSLSDFLIVAGVLAIGSIFLVLGGLDTGSAFGGMGASREMTIATLLEPVVIMAFSTIAFATNQFSLSGMLIAQAGHFSPFMVLIVVALILIALAENARYPVDNPATHLELTMVHEAMILEYSGKYLAILEYAAAIKLTIFSLLVANFIFPASVAAASSLSGAVVAGMIFWSVVKITVAMFGLAGIESILVKMRFYRMSEYFSIAFVVAFLGMVVAILTGAKNISLPYPTLFSLLAVIAVVLLFGRVRLKAILRYYAFSSLAIAAVAWSLVPMVPEEEKIHLWLFAIFTVITKTFAVPYVVNRSSHAKKSLTNLSSFLRPGKSYFLAVSIMIVTYFMLERISIAGLIEKNSLLYASVTLIVLGIATLVIKRNIFSQIIGLLIMENGIAVFVLATVGSLPIAIEFGIFSIAVATAFILAILSSHISQLHGSPDTDELRGLTE